MEFLKRLLFGKKVETEVPLIGKFSCRVNNNHPSAIYGWRNYNSHLLHGTPLLLEGNFEGPFERHINNYLGVINSIDNIIESIKTKFLEKNPTYQLKSIWKEDFTIISISCSGQTTVDLIVGIPNSGCYFVVWREGKIQSIK